MDGDPLLCVGDDSNGVGDDSNGVVDHRVSRSIAGGWNAALLIIGVEIAERSAYYGISLNLITYLTGPLGESTASAAAAVNAWSGVASMLPLLGGFIADSYLGRYWMIFISSILYILGLFMLTLSAVLPVFRPTKCGDDMDPASCSPSQFQVAFFFVSLYLVAFAQGGHKPCVQAFGADQFDQNDPDEFASRSSFFNWSYFAMCGGIVVTLLISTYIQDNIGWGLGFGIPCIAMGGALVIFLLGTKMYRSYPLEGKSPFISVGRTFITMGRNWLSSDKSHPTLNELWTSHGSRHSSLVNEDGDVQSLQVEEAKGILCLFPIWVICLIYGVVFAQSSTFFTKQGSTMDRRIGPSLQVPPAALQCLIAGTIVAFIPIYDRVLVPVTKKFTKMPSGITMLQRIGTGMVFFAISMVAAALAEMKRLKTARDFGLVDLPNTMIPMSLWWLVPQYVLFGISESFTMVGLQEFFYDQVPDSLRSLGSALFLSIFGIGSFISSFLVTMIDEATSRTGDSWFSDNLNRGHLDYFYWLLGGLSAIEFVVYLCFTQGYAYKEK